MAGILGLTGISFGSLATFKQVKSVSVSADGPSWTPSKTYANGDADTYYNGIDSSLTGNNLLTALYNLNVGTNGRRKSTVGYKAMGTSMNSPYIYTDYDPKTVKYDSKGQPYGTKVLNFYTGASITSWNKEHVWPASRLPGGRDSNIVDPDIYMPRPTIPSENGSRGNSVYYEGRANTSSGWDPVEEFGVNDCYGGTSIRGECARIIFYCCTVDNRVVLNEDTDNDGNNMGVLSHLLKWNLENPVNEREKNRNEGGEYIQGNRNAFVDHPEYACKIWGNYNDATKKICGAYNTPPTTITLTTDKTTIAVGSKATINVTVDTGSSQVIWDSSDKTVATVNDGIVSAIKAGTTEISARSALDPNVVGKITINVKAVKELSMTGTPTKTNYFAGQSFNPAGLTITATFTDSTTENVTSAVVWEPSPLYAGLTEVTGKYAGKTVKVSGLTVQNATNYTLIKSTDELEDGDSVVFASKTFNATAGGFSSKYLDKVDSIFSGDEITTLGSGTSEWTLKKNGNSWNFVLDENKLGCSGGDLSIAGGTTDWTISISNGNAKVQSGSSNNVIQYNQSAPRFKTYSSNQQPIELYHKAGGGTGGDDKVHVTSVQLNKNELALEVGKTETLTATVLPENATDKSITWESNNESVATVSNGVVTAVAEGVATITAKSVDGNITDECTVTVTGGQEPIKVTGVALNKTQVSLRVEDTETLVATVNPTGAENKAVTWTTSDQAIATVNDGVVTAIAKGEATITVTTVDGGFTATCKVTVVNKDEPLPTPTPKNGCSGSIVATSSLVAATSLIGLVILGFKKKKEF